MRKILMSGMLICFAFTLCIFAQKGKPQPAPACGSDVRVQVLVEPFAIAPDIINKYYVNGQENVTAIFQVGNCSHDFTMNLNASNRFLTVNLASTIYTAKFFNFDRVHSVPITPTDEISSQAFLSSQFCTAIPQPLDGFNVGLNPDGTYKDNYGGCGYDENGQAYVRRNVGIQLVPPSKRDQLGFRFQYSPVDGGVNAATTDGTAFVRVYHPDPNNWILVPDNESNRTLSTSETIPPIGVRLLNGADSGRFEAPFRIRVQRLP
jgi:hypothetical protein